MTALGPWRTRARHELEVAFGGVQLRAMERALVLAANVRAQRTPEGLEDIAGLPNLTVALSRRGIPPRVIEKILGGNVLRVLDAVPAWGALGSPA